MIVVRLLELLRARGITLLEIHRRTGVSYSALHALARGKTSRLDLATLCSALGVGVGDILEHRPER
jgi:DNA-binding Xre family transcriptional regulator